MALSLFRLASASAAFSMPALAQYHEAPPPAQPHAVGPPATSASSRSPGAIVVRGAFRSVQVNVDQNGNNLVGDAANEPSLAIDPNDESRMVIGWRQFNTVASSFRENGWAHTGDGGATWSPRAVVNPGAFNSDPVLDSDAQGRFYYLSFTGSVLPVSRSDDGGQSWTSLQTISPGGDKPWMAIDRTIATNHVYVAWQVVSGPNTFTRSTDGGGTFGPALALPLVPSVGNMAVAPDGDVYVVGRDGTSSSWADFSLARSTDAKDPALTPTFTGTRLSLGGEMLLSGFNSPVGPPNRGGLLGQAWVAVDPVRPGRVYVLCSVDPPGVDPMDVSLAISTDGGATFAAPIRVNTDPQHGSAWQWFGTMAVAPDGRLDVVWNDTRQSLNAGFCETYYCYSLDGGTTFSPEIPISPGWISIVGGPSGSEKIGDYYQVVSTLDAAHLAYAATFNDEQDIYYARLGDCNQNGVHDGVDIQNGNSFDSNNTGVPDECEFCQADLGFGGPGTMALSFCGDDLKMVGNRATLLLEGAIPFNSMALLIGPNLGPLSFGGILIGPFPGAIGFATRADARGRFALPLTMPAPPGVKSYMQFVQIVPGNPATLDASNTIEIDW